ncbi:hypothetical protein KSS87_010936 [Heliosperma pusillum]|nr:hypothetical protein KSS87_010936 [Heliosperma pusillum]
MSGSTLSNPDDPSSPFIILNVHSVTKFDGSNYRQWRTQLGSLFDGYGLLSFLDGTPPPPKTVASATTQEDPNPAFKTWYRQDKLLFSAVASTVTSAVSPLLNRVSTTNEAWDILASTYARPSRGHIKQLRHKLKHITKGTTSISAYMTRIKTIVDDLALLGTVIPAEDVTDQVLDGLDSTYQPDPSSGAILFKGPAKDGVYYWPMYEELWLPLLSDLTDGHNKDSPMILPPFDIEWVWYCHTLSPVHYSIYCETRFSKVIGKALIFDEENEDYAVNIGRDIWRKRYPNEAFENDVGDSEISAVLERKDGNDLEEFLMGETSKIKDLYGKFFVAPYMGEMVYLIAAKRRYQKMMQLLLQQSSEDFDGGGCSVFVPTVDILIMWITHQSYPTVYAADTKHMEGELLMKVIGPWHRSMNEEDIQETKKLWETTFDQPYEKAGGSVAVGLPDGFAVKTPVYWVVSDSDVNTKYKSLRPRFLLEVSVYVKLRSQIDATIGDKMREFLRLQMYRCHKQLKLDEPISMFSSDTWQSCCHFYCEFGTKGVKVELRHPSNSLCFKGTGLLDSVPLMWNDLLRAPSLAYVSEVDQKIRVFASITPPVQAPYLLKCVPDRVTDDSGAMISDVMLRMNQYRPQEGRWLSRTVLDHARRECFVVRIR